MGSITQETSAWRAECSTSLHESFLNLSALMFDAWPLGLSHDFRDWRFGTRETQVCSRKVTHRTGRAGDDNALPTCGLRAAVRRREWATLSEHKWSSLVSAEEQLHTLSHPRPLALVAHCHQHSKNKTI